MKLKYDFAVREVVGEYVMVPLGAGALAFSGMISTTQTGATLAEALQKEMTHQELLQLILDEYEIDEATAAADLDEFLNQLKQLHLLIE